MKRDRRGRFLAPAPGTRRGQLDEASRVPGGRRGKTRLPADGRTASEESQAGPQHQSEHSGVEKGVEISPVRKGVSEEGPEEIGRAVTTAFCRLCHGKFSSRSLRSAFGKASAIEKTSDKKRQKPQVFFADFQRLVGVPVMQDPVLSRYICKNCYSQFYKCHNILRTFIQRVNLSPVASLRSKGRENLHSTCNAREKSTFDDLITSRTRTLRSLVSWAHQHASTCQTAPSLQEVLGSDYQSVVRAIWCCDDGHNYVMDTYPHHLALDVPAATAVKLESDERLGHTMLDNGAVESSKQPLAATTPSWNTDSHQPVFPEATSLVTSTGIQLQHSISHQPVDTEERLQRIREPLTSLNSAEAGKGMNDLLSSSQTETQEEDEEDSDLSDRDLSSEEEEEKKKSGSSDELFEPHPEKSKVSAKKCESKEVKKKLEPKERKKPGPKPGWKKKIKSEREELPTIYKCPYQGCTAVYRGADGMKKHIKEHHEEVRERPCPHPGCNKVFMIDRYLQRHVKLIHTEVRNYICDECGQTFKQRKHLSVHQMRHSGAKPLQCEVCGFQCRQRASLKYHMTKHKAEAELEFACDQCGKRFEKAHNLNVHMSMVHPLTQNTDKNKSYETVQFIPSDEPQGIERLAETLADPIIHQEIAS
ncbi:zinc finger protein 276 isoform X1 [Polypterus senegalus]|uniref:zinc finger protein 276 isoform X1 n=1 Tax=Polypterus senegalus TaxID=55291 RepID=UPI001963E66D|nr:zinc finger protein 276 isoform X1 [Polypterus senegalus]